MLTVDNTRPPLEADVLEDCPDPRPEPVIQSDAEEIEAAKAVAGPEIRTDGGDGGPDHAELRDGETRDDDNVHAMRNAEQLAEADPGDLGPGPLDVGDHVQDEQDADATMVVVNLDTLQADTYELDKGLTVADVNPEYPANDDVVEVIYPKRTDLELEGKKRYAFPKSRLEVVHRVHDRDGNEGGEDQ